VSPTTWPTTKRVDDRQIRFQRIIRLRVFSGVARIGGCTISVTAAPPELGFSGTTVLLSSPIPSHRTDTTPIEQVF